MTHAEQRAIIERIARSLSTRSIDYAALGLYPAMPEKLERVRAAVFGFEVEPGPLTGEAHRQRHVTLHEMLDELIADFIQHTTALPSDTPIMALMQWSHQQTVEPTEHGRGP